MAGAKSIAIVQSCYIPWKGYFDLINSVDEFVLYDDQQYTRRDWRNRNRIKTAQGTRWLSIPVDVKGKYLQRIDETKVSDPAWSEKHWRTLTHSYSRAPFFEPYREEVGGLYRAFDDVLLSNINRRFLELACSLLGITTRLTSSTGYEVEGRKTERLVAICQAASATRYVSGPSARAYLEPMLFEAAGVELSFIDYTGYPVYEQLYPPFDHAVTILDLLFHTGPSAPAHMTTFAAAARDVHAQ